MQRQSFCFFAYKNYNIREVAIGMLEVDIPVLGILANYNVIAIFPFLHFVKAGQLVNY